MALFTALGYVYMVVMLLCSLALLAAIVWGVILLVNNSFFRVLFFRALIILAPVALALIWGSLLLCWTILKVILRLFFWHVPSPGGMQLPRGMAPRLFQLLDQLARQFQIPKLSGVYLEPNFSAGVVSLPTLGMIARHRHYLTIGLPLLHVLNAEQLKAVLAHEFAHVSGGHSRTLNWIKVTLRIWEQLLESFQNDEGRDFGWLRAFFSWYAPILALRLHALQRSYEYAADRTAKRVAGAARCAEALVTIHLYDIWHSEILNPEVWKAAKSNPEIPVCTNLIDAYARGIPTDTASEMLKVVLAEEIDYSDRHPPFAERLALLGYSPKQPGGDAIHHAPAIPLPVTPEITAASYYLGATAREAVNFLDHVYAEIIREQAKGPTRPQVRAR
ncbi:MAG: M48 family metallopeptidase [bacterium]